MKKLLFLFSISGFLACHSGEGNTGSTDSISDSSHKNDSSSVSGPTSATKGDADFMSAVTDAGMTEIQASQAAEQLSKNQRVKDFAAMMIRDHGSWGDQVKSIAQSRNVSLPAAISDDHQKAVSDLQKKSGPAFDRAYMHMMVHDHEGALKDFQGAQSTVQDSALLKFVNNTIPGIQMHLDSAKAIDKGI
jgi:putative membrane protein